LLLLAVMPASASAAIFRVDRTGDTPVGQNCNLSPQNCSLRQAVTSANAFSGADAVQVPAGAYPLANGELDVTEDLEVSRVGAGAATISGSDSSRIFDVSGSGTDFILRFMSLTEGMAAGVNSVAGGAIRGGSGTTIAVESSTITDNHVVATGSGASGGAIYTTGGLTIGVAPIGSTPSVISANSATSPGSAEGGGIVSDNTVDQLVIGSRTEIRNNTVAGGEAQGGGVFSRDGASLDRATISGNVAAGTRAMGGAIYLSRGTTTLTRTTLSGNHALASSSSGANSVAFGGGIGIDYPADRDGTVEASLSTITGNTAVADSNATEQALGGAVATSQGATGGADNVFENSTVTGNIVDDPDGGEVGGAFYDGFDNDFVLGGSIVAGNFPDASSQCSDGTVVSTGYNVLGDVSDCAYTASAGDVTGVTDPGLTALGDFGGLTETMVPELGSPALGIVPAANALCAAPATDQRDIARPQPVAGSCDSGSVEARPATLTITPDPRSFPSVTVGSNSTADVSISNGGDLAMGAAPSPGTPLPFSYVSGCASPVAAGANCVMTLRFSPAAAGSFSETLTVTSGALSDTATLAGTASGPAAGDPGPSDPGPSDPGPTDPEPPGNAEDREPPETTITNRPKNASPRHTRYRFRSSEPSSTFTCKLDDREAEPCDGGGIDLRNLERGRHTFEVFATDAAGNDDPSPATDRFRVRPKRKR
jgi:hypothetical protein